MHRIRTAALAAWIVLGALSPARARAQGWNDARSLDLVGRATTLRTRQLADTGLRDYKAVAHGYVTFLAQIGETLSEPPKVVKADELMNEIYWLAPNLSKQHIVGRRDTLLLPTDISYHRDHLGIVQNNFPDFIRLGDGDETRDVPHPLSSAGLAAYDFRISADSFTMQSPGRTIHVLEVKVRPKNDRQARIIGALYIDRDDAQVVRMAFNFTRAALLDNALEDVFVIIENRLVSGRFWLPSRQEIEITRGGAWLDYPIRGIIRGRWEIGNYAVNTGLSPSMFGGPEIVLAPRAVTDTFHFGGRILDSLPPDVRAVTDADIQAVRAEARALVRQQALRRPQALSLAAAGASDFVRFDRAEGFAVGAGLLSRFGGGFGAQVKGRYGVDDRSLKGGLTASWQNTSIAIRAFAMRDYREAGDITERSGAINSLAAQEFGGDATDPYLTQGGGIGVDAFSIFGTRFHVDGSIERQSALSIRATPSSGAFDPLVSAARGRVQRLSIRAERPTSLWYFGSELRVNGELRASNFDSDDLAIFAHNTSVFRGDATVNIERPFGDNRLVVFASGGGVGATHAIPAQEFLYFGGPVSSPGYAFHELVGDAGGTVRVEWRTPVSGPGFSLGRFGRIPPTATLAPFIQATAIDARSFDVAHPDGVYPSIGLALQPLLDLVRLQLARGLRKGRWTFNFDVSRDFWGIL